MEFSLREWLILIGVAIIVVILIDGLRRYKKGPDSASSDDELDVDNSDSSNRPISAYKAQSGSKKSSRTPIASAFENAKNTTSAPLTDIPHKVDSGPELDRDEEMHLDELASLVPEKEFGDTAIAEQDYVDNGFYEQDQLDLGFGFETEEQEKAFSNRKNKKRKKKPEVQQDLDLGNNEDYESNYSKVDIDQVTPQGAVDDLNDNEVDATSSEPAEIEEVIVINILAPDEQNFSGMELLQLILNCGMRYGDMDIFHRHEDGFDRGKVQFSMANAIEPGTFDLETMGEGECPGVSFFMGLPGPKDSMKAFDFMLETAQALVRNLGGELRDERRTPMSDQTIAHCRQRIKDFERRRLMKTK